MDNPLSTQIGGGHYKGMKIEPFTFGMANCYDPAAFSIMKYVSRHHLKGGREDLLKARHIIFIRVSEMPEDIPAARSTIPVETYIEENSLVIFEREASILRDLHHWATRGYPSGITDETVANFLAQKIDLLIAETYPEEKD